MDNKTIVLKCIEEDFSGNGIVKFGTEDKKIPGLLKDEEGLFEIVNNGKYQNLILKKIQKVSNDRIEPLCKEHSICGGCQFQHVSYEHELKLKDDYIKSLFKSSYGVEIYETIKMNEPYYYRNKCQMVYKLSKTKKAVCGFYEEGSHKIVTIDDCKIHTKKAKALVDAFNKALNKNHILPYDEKTRTGIVRHIIIKYGINTGEIMLCIVTNGEFFPGRKNVVNDLLKEKLNITTIVQNYNDRDTSVVMGDRERVLFGKGYIIDTIEEFKFKISSRSFFQVNPEGMKLLYKNAIEKLNIKKTDVVLDTYCGVGTIGILMSKYAKMVYGVELNKDAYKDSIENARLNNIKNIKFFNEDSTKFIKSIANSKEHIDLLVLDPPRDGSTKEFINAVGVLKPKRVVYISCEPRSLVRDLYDFTKNNYKIISIQPVDMFPRTANLECVCTLVLKTD